ncbi:uncharacterized protein LOC143040752 [Oratosquilla oratoria]|uniref:uncharacterized protein LOC143040752 n=1 Tax=Oratosquilla oratoria TaxID=337810 RepID=UPI003F769D14
MKSIAVLCACVIAGVSAVGFPTTSFTDGADPGLACLNLTTCQTAEAQSSYYLPYCAKFVCNVAEDGTKIEQVQFCNNVPLDNQNCEVVNAENSTEPFPHCCPVFSCDNVQYHNDTTTRQALSQYRYLAQVNICPDLFPEVVGQGQEGQGQA